MEKDYKHKTLSQSMKKQDIHDFNIAELDIRIIFEGDGTNNISLIPSFSPFVTNESKGERLFTFTVLDELEPIAEDKLDNIRNFDTGNGDTNVDKIIDGGYQFSIKNINNKECCLLITNDDFTECRCKLSGTYTMRSFGLNNALILIYAFAGGFKDTCLIHASLVRQNGYGYAFIAKSGTGKSTQVSSWLRYIPNCDLMNDDSPAIRIINNEAFIYGTPWSGKTPCYRKVKAKLGAITRIDRASANSIDHLRPVEAVASVLPAISTMKWDKVIYNNTHKIIFKLVELTSHLSNKQFLPEVIKVIQEGHTATISLRGYSMRPFLEDGRDKAILTKPTNIKVGDPVLAELTGQQYVLHRIIAINGNDVVLRGDGNYLCEYCTLDDIRASVVGFYRKGRKTIDYTNHWKWKTYSFFWTRLFPIRRYLLYIYRKVFL